ncbi:hypothetical protein DEJ16_04965 [Curtobacterium sp. MCJR17_055]|uniref:prepilin-type N-terminal cleavage/methylation domain-containing protein n=1 Tax=unclassified Curtobacterium TaxID=257496 RepID=UPI000D97B6FB|nr:MULTISPECIES: prepilin-type N-terminal cleavage/methylation domain-containing protein [unclassified Curtobacterium]PYY37696.1 hypothetical protein DEI87_00720 [Curtobacterium sp. MCBD17_029]PYY56724.1 hypothetical protein DEJ16_04965 [Curtobacterium sp. MCJR17_055]PYY62361.1 hypothetical protein DEJ26_02560 [Curtobacterium sp. MCPF17_015]
MRRISFLLQSARERQDGFTIIEVMVAMTVFAMIAAGVAAGIVSSIYLTQDNRSREAALNLATQEIDRVRSVKDVFTVTNSSSPAQVGGQQYTVTRSVNWITSTGSDNTCGAGDGVLAYKRVNVQVAWSNGTSSKQRSVDIDTLVAPPTSVASNTSSTIVIAVSTANGAPNTDATVTVRPVGGGAALPPEQPAPTDANGCSYAVDVKPGTYEVSVSKSGNTDEDFASTASKQVATVAGSVASQSFVLDQPASVTLQYAANARAGSNPKLPSGLSASFVRGQTVTTVTSSQTRVFPYGYDVYAGKYDKRTCANVNPLAWSIPTTSNLMVDAASVPTGVGGVAGDSSTVKIPMGLIDVKLVGSDTVLVATPTPGPGTANDPGCTTQPATTYTFTGLDSRTATTIALPYGAFQFKEGTSAAALGPNTPVFAASAGATNVNVTVSGRTVLFDPRTKGAP